MYLVTFTDNTEQKFTSITKAVKSIENHFQCGTAQTLQDIKKSLRLVGMTQVKHCMDETINCWIEKA